MALIHPTALIDPGAKLAEGISIGPYSIIGQEVTIGEGTEVQAHCFIEHATIGKNCRISPYTVIGTPPQDLKYKNEPTRLILGDECVLREFVTLNRGTLADGGKGITAIGNNCFFMAYSHVGHDCEVGNNVVLVNCAALGGHVLVEDNVMFGGLSAAHQFVRVGRLTMVGGGTGVERDLPPYSLVEGNRGKIVGVNLIGLRRKGYSRTQIANIQDAFSALFFNGKTLKDDLTHLEGDHPSAELEPLIKFLKSPSKRGLSESISKNN